MIKLLIYVYFVSLTWFEPKHSFINSAAYWASTMFEEKKRNGHQKAHNVLEGRQQAQECEYRVWSIYMVFKLVHAAITKIFELSGF